MPTMLHVVYRKQKEDDDEVEEDVAVEVVEEGVCNDGVDKVTNSNGIVLDRTCTPRRPPCPAWVQKCMMYV